MDLQQTKADITNCISQEQLNQQVTHEHADEISLKMTKWEDWASALELLPTQIEDINREYETMHTKRLAVLRVWKESFGSKATYEKLIDALLKLRQRKMAEFVCSLLKTPSIPEEDFSMQSLVDSVQGMAYVKSRKYGGPAGVFGAVVAVVTVLCILYVLVADCGDLAKLQNGNVLVTRSIFGSIAEYSCDHGYKLIGNNMRQCQWKRWWSGFAPDCKLPECPEGTTSFISEDQEFLLFRRGVCLDYKRWTPTKHENAPLCFVKRYINLTLVEAERIPVTTNRMNPEYFLQESIKYNVTGKTVLRSFSDLFPRGVDSCEILVEAAPGMGKTFLAHQVANEWAHGRLPQFSLVLLFDLRFQNVLLSDGLLELVKAFHPKPSVDIHSAVSDINRAFGETLLIIFDGADEVPGEKLMRSYVGAVIRGKQLQKACVIVTSRPFGDAIPHLREYATKRVQILGFSPKDIQYYLKAALPSLSPTYHGKEFFYLFSSCPLVVNTNVSGTAEHFQAQVAEHHLTRDVIHMPLILSIAVHLFVTNNYIVPSDPLELYGDFILSNLRRDVHLRSGQKEFWINRTKIKSLRDLPPDTLSKYFNFCHFALVKLLEFKFVFPRAEVLNAVFGEKSPLTDEMNSFDGFGLLQALQAEGKYGEVSYVFFIHRTFQSYLAFTYFEYVYKHANRTQPIGSGITTSFFPNIFRMIIILHIDYMGHKEFSDFFPSWKFFSAEFSASYYDSVKSGY